MTNRAICQVYYSTRLAELECTDSGPHLVQPTPPILPAFSTSHSSLPIRNTHQTANSDATGSATVHRASAGLSMHRGILLNPQLWPEMLCRNRAMGTKLHRIRGAVFQCSASIRIVLNEEGTCVGRVSLASVVLAKICLAICSSKSQEHLLRCLLVFVLALPHLQN